jgi:hypothetical protein
LLVGVLARRSDRYDVDVAELFCSFVSAVGPK